MKALALEHRADIERSGISESTIELLGLEAVNPAVLNVHGATSAYKFPYFTLEGKKNCFERWRLFPVIKHPDGSSQKYHQAPGTAPQLYLPPLFRWSAVASNPGCELLIVEGEKKSAAACERGLFAAGVAGVWNWRQRLDSGERLSIPILDQFVWSGRTVDLIPDSDAWREDKQLAILSGFYALGQELISREATVRLLKLPERSGVKVGLDDWLVAAGAQWETLWPAMERVPLDDARLTSLAARWQSWRQKQALEKEFRTQQAEDLDIQEAAGLFTVTFPAYRARFSFDRLQDARDKVTAELTVRLGGTELLGETDIGLKSESSRAKVAGTLKHITSDIPWLRLLERACTGVLKRHREGEPPIVLSRQLQVEPISFLVNPFVYRHKTTVLYGDSGLGKSTFALLLSMLVASGQSVAGISALPGKALYLDYEDHEDIHTLRLKAIGMGHPELAEAQVSYQYCSTPLPVMAPQLLRRIHDEQLTFLVIDSMAAASGTTDAEGSTRFFGALRPLRISTLVLAHVPKAQEGVEPSIYGSVFNKNFARSTWEIRKQQESESDHVDLGFFHHKSNLGRLHAPLGFRYSCDRDTTCIHYDVTDVGDSPELARSLSVKERLLRALPHGVRKTIEVLAEEIDASNKVVRNKLGDLRQDKKVEKYGQEWGRA